MISFDHSLIEPGIIALSFLLAGILIGGLYVKFRLQNRFLQMELQKGTEIATLNESLRHATADVDAINARLDQVLSDNVDLNEKYMQLAKAHATAQVRLDRLAVLEAALGKHEAVLKELSAENSALKQKRAELEIIVQKERQAVSEKAALIDDIKNKMPDTFKMLSAGVLKENNQSFLDLAKTTLSGYFQTTLKDIDNRNESIHNVIKPVKEALVKYDQHVQTMELAREKAYGGLKQQVNSLIQTQQELQKETGKLAKSLRVPHVRGRWGEITLKRVAELSGMQHHCDFYEQQSVKSEDKMLRPDMTVHLPNARKIIVDAKVPLTAYLDALDADNEEQKESLMADHAKQVAHHIKQLSQKSYWRQFAETPEFVVLFIPGENFFSAALTQNPALIEEGINSGVVLATPTTLISLLKAVSYGWHQATAAENARAISELGKELYQRLNLMVGHINKLGRDIEKSTQTYNQVVGSLEKRVMASARRFSELGINFKENDALEFAEPVQSNVRQINV